MPVVVTNTKLLIACWATIGVLLAMALVFIRSKRRHYGFAVLPLTIPPAMYILSGVLARTIDPTIPPITSVQIRIILDFAAALVACVLIGWTSNMISKKRKVRTVFVICCSLFIIVFSSFLIMDSVVQYVAIT